jgi:hypothetical protein
MDLVGVPNVGGDAIADVYRSISKGEKYAGNPGTLPHGATGIDVVDVSQRPGTGTTMRMI